MQICLANSSLYCIIKIYVTNTFRMPLKKHMLWWLRCLVLVQDCFASAGDQEHQVHKELTYKEYRSVYGVFRTIDPPSPLPLASVSSPRTKGGGYTLARRWGGGGQYFGRRQHWIGLLQYNPSTIRSILITCFLHFLLQNDGSRHLTLPKDYEETTC